MEREIARFEDDGRSPSEGYGWRVALAVRDLVTEAATTRLGELAAGTCEPFVKADFPDTGFATGEPDGTDERFEAGFVRTEMVACFHADTVACRKPGAECATRGVEGSGAELTAKRGFLKGDFDCA